MRTKKKGKWVSCESPAYCCLGCVHFRRGDNSYRSKQGECRKHPVVVPVDFDYRCSEFDHDGATGEYWVRREEDSVRWFQRSDALIEAQNQILSERKRYEAKIEQIGAGYYRACNRGLWARIWNR
jgi:hypothetical protein